MLTIDLIESWALRCLGSKKSKAATEFASLVGMQPDRFCAEVESGHARELAAKLNERFTGIGGGAMFDDLKCIVANSSTRYFPTGLYEIGLCHYGRKEPYKTIEVAAENIRDAMDKGRKELAPTTVEHICHVGTRPNPEFTEEQARWISIRDACAIADTIEAQNLQLEDTQLSAQHQETRRQTMRM